MERELAKKIFTLNGIFENGILCIELYFACEIFQFSEQKQKTTEDCTDMDTFTSKSAIMEIEYSCSDI